MKLRLTHNDFAALLYPIQRYLFDWQRRKGYPYNPLLTIGELIVFLQDESQYFHKDDILHGTKNCVLDCPEVVVAYDGDELADILLYEAVQVIKRKLAVRVTL